MSRGPTVKVLQAEIAALTSRLEEVDEMLRALRADEVDAIVVGDKLYTLESADSASNRLRGEALAQMVDAVVATDLEGCITYLNPAAEKLYRQSASAVLGRPLDSLFSTVGAGMHRRSDGSQIAVEAVPSSLRDAAQQPVGQLTVVRDLTERERAEAVHREHRHFVERVMAVAPGVVYVFDLEARRNVFFSDSVSAAIGYSSGELMAMGKTAGERLMHPQELPLLAAHYERLTRARDGDVLNVEQRVRHANGTWRWFRSHDAVFSRAADGRVRQVIGTAIDITEWRAASRELVRREREFSTLVENSPDIVARLDRELRYSYISPAIERYTGRSPAQYLGRGDTELDAAASWHGPWDDAVRQVLERSVVHRLSFALTTPLGEQRHLDARVMPEAAPDGSVESVLVVCSDVTERERAEQALRDADRQKGRFIATLAHELRNPLTPISNALEIMKRSTDPEVRERARQIIERQHKQLVRLVDDLLDINRIDHDMLELRKAPIDMAAVLRDAVETCSPLIEKAAHRLELQLPLQPLLVDGDRVRLAQVFANVLNNSAKFSPPGSRIAIEVRRDGAEMVATVRDEGIGVEPAMVGGLFEMFHQARGAQDALRGGLGIGLALVRRLVQLHGGSVSAHSAGAGQGMVITVRLPLSASSESLPVRSDAPGGDATAAPGASLRVLVADDDTDNAETLAALLRLLGCETLTACNGQMAVDHAEAWRPQIAFLDIGMPVLDGVGAAREIRARPWGRELTLVALTGWGQERDRERTREAGFDQHFVKPLDFEKVEQLIAAAAAAAKAPSAAA